MTVLLVVFSLIVLLTADFVVQKKRHKKVGSLAIRAVQNNSPEQWHLSDDIVFAPNHVWMRRERNNSITMGIDNFLLGLTGVADALVLPRAGEIVGKGFPAIQLRHKNKTLRIHSPIEGQVLEANVNAEHQPGLIAGNPYSTGWLFNIVPFDSAVPLGSFLKGANAIEWLKKQQLSFKEFLSSRLPQLDFVTMQDGGIPVDGVLKEFNQDVWNEFQARFASLAPEPETMGEYDNA
ncbi:MAG: hypothetical protein ABI623_10695 [bacterium]